MTKMLSSLLILGWSEPLWLRVGGVVLERDPHTSLITSDMRADQVD